MRTKDVIVLPYKEEWKQDFINIKKEIVEALGKLAIAVEHVGSTSVEGLAAKPIIDIDKYIDYKSPVIEEIYERMDVQL